MSSKPSPTGDNGPGDRDQGGRFLPGNRAARGNPHARKAQQLRSALLRTVGSGDVRRVARKLVDLAAGGDVQAARLLLERLLGPPVAADFEERLAELEAALLDKERTP